ncbi:hypothetical protein QAD02_007859 [Eretmocerus hayati]|uniref:Uncharacterized protein n=1 Tax=Eretmocerus hayati TaxID=131215 RepID=A0ACC2N4V0_9HYME|nr:hypothetical protein QAD02_007859 [Eretmocerus hayati]
MTTAVECWQWIMTARPELKLNFLQEMLAAWSVTVEKRMGLFAGVLQGIDPLAAHEGCELSPSPPSVDEHEIWVSFIVELIETGKYCCQETIEMITSLLHRSLPMNVGGILRETHLNQDVAAVGVRFKLLACGLLLLQGDILTKSLHKNILRERIYCNCLDYFCCGRLCPTQDQDRLKEDLETLIRFWQIMHSEKKYLMFTTGDVDHEHPKILQTPHLTVGLSPLESISSSTGNEIPKSSTWMYTTPNSASSYTLSKRSNRVKKASAGSTYIKDYIRKRNLILELLAVEIEFLLVRMSSISGLIYDVKSSSEDTGP